jgi:hypothetical protein
VYDPSDWSVCLPLLVDFAVSRVYQIYFAINNLWQPVDKMAVVTSSCSDRRGVLECVCPSVYVIKKMYQIIKYIPEAL